MLTRKHFFSLAVAVITSLSMAVPALAQNSDDVTVTGTVDPVLELTMFDGAIAFGNVDPTGANGGAADSVGNPSAGACYLAADTANFTVRSNETYDGSVVSGNNNGDGEVDNNKLKSAGVSEDAANTDAFLDAGSTVDTLDYQDCTATPGLDTAQNWVSGAVPTSEDDYFASLALQVDWEDEAGTIDFTVTYSISQV